MGEPPNPRSLTLWANGPGLVLRFRGTKYSMPRPRGRGPFGNARRSGCPPAEPYPADDDQVSFLTRSIPSTSISTRRNPVLVRPRHFQIFDPVDFLAVLSQPIPDNSDHTTNNGHETLDVTVNSDRLIMIKSVAEVEGTESFTTTWGHDETGSLALGRRLQ